MGRAEVGRLVVTVAALAVLTCLCLRTAAAETAYADRLPPSIAAAPDEVVARAGGEPIRVADLTMAALDPQPLWHSAPLGKRETLVRYAIDLKLAADAARSLGGPDGALVLARARFVVERALFNYYRHRSSRDLVTPAKLRAAYDRELAAARRTGSPPSFEERRAAIREGIVNQATDGIVRPLWEGATFADPDPAQRERGLLLTVNGEPVTEADITALTSLTQLRGSTAEERRKTALGLRVAVMLIAQAARRAGLADEPAVSGRLAYFERKSLAGDFVERDIAEQISEAAIQAFYDTEFLREQIRLQSFYSSEGMDKARADKLIAALRRGTSPERAGKAVGASVEDRYLSKETLLDSYPFGAELWNLKPGEARAFRGLDGTYLVHRSLGTRSKPPLEEVKADIAEYLKEQALKETFLSLRNAAEIEQVSEKPEQPARRRPGPNAVAWDLSADVYSCTDSDGASVALRFDGAAASVTTFSADGREQVDAYEVRKDAEEAFYLYRSQNGAADIVETGYEKLQWFKVDRMAPVLKEMGRTLTRTAACQQHTAL